MQPDRECRIYRAKQAPDRDHVLLYQPLLIADVRLGRRLERGAEDRDDASVPEPRSEWSLWASCAACRETFSLSSAAVLVRSSSQRPRGVLLDVLGERWPEGGRLLHSRCFAQQFGRPALWTSFVRGRFDKGVAPVRRSRKDSHVGEVVSADAAWLLSVNCCDCSKPVEPSGPAVVREERAPQRWRWAPVLQERRPGQRRVYHLHCFVGGHGRSAAYGLLGLDLWDHTPKVVKRLAGMLNPLP